jgi:hypothetical protein
VGGPRSYRGEKKKTTAAAPTATSRSPRVINRSLSWLRLWRAWARSLAWLGLSNVEWWPMVQGAGAVEAVTTSRLAKPESVECSSSGNRKTLGLRGMREFLRAGLAAGTVTRGECLQAWPLDRGSYRSVRPVSPHLDSTYSVRISMPSAQRSDVGR